MSMLIDPYRGGLGPIQFIASANAENTPAPLDIPAHAANDLIVAWAHGNAFTNVPALPSGWTNILSSGARTSGNPTRLYCIRDTGNTVNTLSLPSNTANIGFLVYRNASGAGAASMAAESGPATSYATPSLGSLTAGSWVIAGFDNNQGDDAITDPAALTSRIRRLVTKGGGTGSVADSNGILSSYSGGDTFSLPTNGFGAAFAFEILNG